MAGEVIPFPVQRSCFLCKHHLASGWCEEFDTLIDSEIFAAKDCEEYTPCPSDR